MRVQQLACSWLVAIALAACGRIGFEPGDGDAGGQGSGWLDPAWRYRKPLIIDHTKVAGDLVNFPVLVELDDPDLANAANQGMDLRFVDASGDLLAHELARFDTTVAPVRLHAWVKVPAVSSTVDTTIYLYYGNPAASDSQQASVVWLDYAGVYHLDQVMPVDIVDASGKNAGTNYGAAAAPGQILGSAVFPGGTDTNVRAGAVAVDTSPGGFNTVSFWLHYTGAYGNAAFAFYDAQSNGYDLWMQGAPCFGFNTENSDVLGIPANSLVMRWVHVAAVFYNGTADTTNNQIWIDGIRQTLTQCTGTPLPRTAGNIILGSGGTYSLSGSLDEVRVIAGLRPSGWLLTEYRNLSAPSTFITAGAVELAP